MAGEWIKMRHGLAQDPRVATMARALGVTRQHIVGCLFQVWTLADLHALSRICPAPGGTNVPITEGFLSGYTPDDLDHEARQPGLAAQLASPAVGWLTVYEDGIAFPEFDVHMSQSAKTRALEAKRKQNQRYGRDKCPATSGTNVPPPAGQMAGQKPGLEEEEEVNTGTPPKPPPCGTGTTFPPPLDDPTFAEVWDRWRTHRSQIKAKLTPEQEAAQLKKLAAEGLTAAVARLERSIANGWRGLWFREDGPRGNGRPASGDEQLLREIGANLGRTADGPP